MDKNEQIKHVENLLYQYKKTKRKIILMIENLENIVLKKYSSIGGANSSNNEFKSEFEQKEEIKEKILKKIEDYKKLVKLTEDLLDSIKNEKYYKIIELKYLEKKTIEEISEILEKTSRTITTEKKRLIEILAENLFPI